MKNNIPTTLPEAVFNAALTFLPMSTKFVKDGDQYLTYISALSHGIWISMCDTSFTQHADVMSALVSQIDAVIDDPKFEILKS
jgi:hypothetical protein